MHVIRVIAPALDPAPVWAHVWDGEYLVEVVDLEDGRCELVTTPWREKAREFVDAGDAFEFWTRVHTYVPLRPDGKLNRPLTAWTIEVLPEHASPIPLPTSGR